MLQTLARLTIAVALLVSGVVSSAGAQSSSAPAQPPMMKDHQMTQTRPSAPTKAGSGRAPKVSKQSPAAEYTPTVRFSLRSELAEGKMAFVGVGGDIDGVVNPTLRVAEGDIVQIA